MRFQLILPRRARCSLAATLCAAASVICASGLHAQLSPADSGRLRTTIQTLVSERRLDTERAARARDALQQAARGAETRDALLFDYAAGAALNWENETSRDAVMGYDRHFLVRLGGFGSEGGPLAGYVRRPNGFDPLATMATRWIPALGEPKVRYAAFDGVDTRVLSEAESEISLDTVAVDFMYDYNSLRDHGVRSDQAYDSVTARRPGALSILMTRLFYPWGQRLLRDYTMFEAGADAREYLEAHHVYLYRQAHRDARPVQRFFASDPFAMLSRRLMDAMRSDQAAIRRLLNAVIDSALAEPTVAAQPRAHDIPSGTPSFEGLENASASELRGLRVRSDPTTTSTYRHRLSVLHVYIATLTPADREMHFGRVSDRAGALAYDGDGVVAIIEEQRRTQGEAAAYQTLDRFIVRLQSFIR